MTLLQYWIRYAEIVTGQFPALTLRVTCQFVPSMPHLSANWRMPSPLLLVTEHLLVIGPVLEDADIVQPAFYFVV